MADKYGRVRIPQKILKKIDSTRFIIVLRDNEIVLKPLKYMKFKDLFDTVEVNVSTEYFRDYSELKKYLIREKIVEIH